MAWTIAHRRGLFGWFFIVFCFLCSALIVTAARAEAHKYGCMVDLFGKRYDCAKHKHYKKVKRKKVAHHSKKWRRENGYYDGEVYGNVRRRRCGDPIRVIGGLKVGLESAKQNAKEAWAENARWDMGGKWADWSNAARAKVKCAQTRQGKAAGEYLHKCEIVARPCLPETSRGDDR
jgi:hypothetical protein